MKMLTSSAWSSGTQRGQRQLCRKYIEYGCKTDHMNAKMLTENKVLVPQKNFITFFHSLIDASNIT